MKKNRILTESQKKQIIDAKQKNIIENFANVFNKIKRLDENELNNELPQDVVNYISTTITTKSDDIEGGMEFNNGKLKTIFDEATEIKNSCTEFKYEFHIRIHNKGDELFYDIKVSVDFTLKVYPGNIGSRLHPPEPTELEISDINITNIKITTKDYDELIQIFKTTNDSLITLIGDEIEDTLTLIADEGGFEIDCDEY